MAKKYYAVRKGRNTGVFETWDECKSQLADFREPLIKVLQAGKRLWIL